MCSDGSGYNIGEFQRAFLREFPGSPHVMYFNFVTVDYASQAADWTQ